MESQTCGKVCEFEMIPTYQIFYNEESMFGIYAFCTKDQIPQFSPYNDNKFDDSGDKEYVASKLVGEVQQLYIGTKYNVKATCIYSQKYHEYQYKPISVVADVPKTQTDQLMFLKTQAKESIAESLLAEYPNIIEDVMAGKCKTIDTSMIKGLGNKTWAKLREKIINNYVISEVVVMLQPHGITFNMIKKLVEAEPDPEKLKYKINTNPYILTKIRGLGFKKVDDIALKIRPELRDSKYRLDYFMTYYLTNLGESDGHTYMAIATLRSEVSTTVGECLHIFDDYVENDFPSDIYVSGELIGLKKYHDTEMNILALLQERRDTNSTKKKEIITVNEIGQVIAEVEKEEGFTFSEEQNKGIYTALQTNVVLISGEAGTGKTTLLKPIIRCYKKRNYSIAACALSAKAAQRIQEATELEARTIHRLLEAQGVDSFMHDANNPLPIDVVLLDEASMVNAGLFYQLLLAIRPGTKIIISGDHMQLPPIGYGNIFSDLLKMDELDSVQLTKPMRQAEKSGILSDARKVRRAISPIEDFSAKQVHGELHDMFYIFRNNRENIFNLVVKQFMTCVKQDGMDNVVVISPRKSGCINSTEELNVAIQKELYKNKSNARFVTYGKTKKFYVGDKVLQTSNDYERNTFNGDIGYITGIDYDKKVVHAMMNPDMDKKMIEYSFAQLGQLQLAYALTTHKLQGSAAQTVIGIIDNTHYKLLDNCMLYTMLTRAKKRFALLAEPEAFKRCIVTNHNKRRTWLSLKN